MTNKTHDTNPVKTTKACRWFRFRLRTLLITVTLVSVSLGWVGWELDQRRREKATIAWIEEMGGLVNFVDFHSVLPGAPTTQSQTSWEKTKDNWFGKRVWVLNLNATRVSDLSPLAELTNLKCLTLYNTQVKDLSPLSELKNLKWLYLADTHVTDLSPLTELKKLEYLYLRNTQESDLSPLAELNNLKVLYLAGPKVSDLSPLRKLKGLETLAINCTQVSDEKVEQLRRALPNCKIN